MSKDFVQIANDVMAGMGLLRQGAPAVRGTLPRGAVTIATR